MNVAIFALGLGFGHAARMSVLTEKFGWPLITYGDGVEYCQQQGIPYIDAGVPLKLNGGKIENLKEQISPETIKTTKEYFDWADVIIVDTCVIGVLLAEIFRKDVILVVNDTQTVSLARHTKPITLPLLLQIYSGIKKIVVPDLPPPFTICLDNLHPSLKYEFVGPLVKLPPQEPGPEVVISAKIGGLIKEPVRYLEHAQVYVHHGGHTSSMEGLLAGVPQITISDIQERTNNGKGLERLGVGINIPKNFFTQAGLELAIEIAKEKKPVAEKWKTYVKRFNAAEKIREIVETLDSSKVLS